MTRATPPADFPPELAARLARLAPRLTALRRDLHRHPEPGWCEFRTAALAVARLLDLGFAVRMGADAAVAARRMGVPPADVMAEARERALAAGADPALVANMGEGLTGFWADLDCGSGKADQSRPQSRGDPGIEGDEESIRSGQGPVTAFRFDMDCNTLTESAAPDHRPAAEGFASLYPGRMHACGHDGHVALGIVLAEALADAARSRPDLWGGRIRLIFQPAEEGARGALPLTEAGAVDGVDRIIGLHVGFQAAEGEIICGTQGFFATTKRDVTFTGRAAHAAAAPEEGRNALLAACSATLALHAMPRHGGGPTRVCVGRLHGGEARNIIPAHARLELETRGATADLEAAMSAEAERIVQAAAAMWGCSCAVETVGGSCAAASDPDLAGWIAEEAERMGRFRSIIPMRDFGATEDVAWMMRAVQEQGGDASYLQLGAARPAGHHQPRFDFDENCLPLGLELLMRIAWRSNGPGRGLGG